MEKEQCRNMAGLVNRILLGLLMVVPGLLKLFVVGQSGVSGMLQNLGFPVAGAFAWILIMCELGSGIAILAKWQLKYTAVIPAIILIIAGFTVYLSQTTIPTFLLHLAVASNYVMLAAWDCKKE